MQQVGATHKKAKHCWDIGYCPNYVNGVDWTNSMTTSLSIRGSRHNSLAIVWVVITDP